MSIEESVELVWVSRLSDGVSDINCEEITTCQVAINDAKINVVCVNMEWLVPSRISNGGFSCCAYRRRLRPNNAMFAMGLVPDGCDGRSFLAGFCAGSQLGLDERNGRPFRK